MSVNVLPQCMGLTTYCLPTTAWCSQEYNTEAAFAAAVLLSSLALFTLFIKDKVEQAAAAETRK
jgi:sulfate transport system permease protein